MFNYYNNITSLFVAVLLGIACLCLTSCDAPHDNPLDPESENYVAPDTSLHDLSDFSARVRSLHTARNFPTTDTYSLVVEGWTNEEIELDSVWVTYRDRQPEQFDRIDVGVWGYIFTPGYFNSDDPTMVGVLGQPFIVRFAVTGDTIYTLDPVYLIRVIEATPTLISPMARDTVGAQPQLQWNDFEAPFDFHYLAVVWRNESGFQAEAWRSDTLDSDRKEIQVAQSLANGNYFWVLFAIDEFMNYTRSREGDFVVRGP